MILYNLGVGSGPAKDTCELRYIYENHEDFMVSKNLKDALICKFTREYHLEKPIFTKIGTNNFRKKITKIVIYVLQRKF